MEGKISVIVPIYNQEQYLNKSISSIINQKYDNLEIILVNDGSTDSSIQIIDDFALKDSRIRVFSKPNGGLVDATIYGINQATGEYIAFLDPDDYIGPLYLWDLLSQMDDDIDFVASGFYRNNNGQFIPVILSEDSKIVGDQFQKLRDHYLLDGKIDFSDKIFISRWNKLYRTNVVKAVAESFFNYREVTLGEDSIFTYLVLSQSRGCKAIKGPKDYFYNVGNQNSMMVSNTIERHMEKSKLAYNSLKNLLINEGLSTKQAYALYFFEVESVFERLMKTDFEQFRKLYYQLRKDEVYTTSLKLFRNLSYSARTWIRVFGRLYFPAFLYSYIRLKLKSDLKTLKLFLDNAKFIFKYLVKNGLVKTWYQIKFRRRRDNNFKEINKYLPIIDSRVKEIITSYTDRKTELDECPVCNNIFLFWWDGFDTAPELVKACTETVYKYYPDCTIHLIDKNNYRKFTDIDNVILTDFEKGKISIQVFSDILRFNLLKNNGGIWIDSTIMFFNKMDLLKNLNNKPIESLEFSSTRYFMKYEKYNCSWSGYFFASRKGSLFVKVVDEVFREYYLKYKDYSTYFFIDMVLMMCKKYGLDDNALDNIHFVDGDMMLMLRTLGDEYNKCYLSQYEAVPQKLEWRYKGKGKKNTNYCHYIQNGIQDRRSVT